MTDVKFRGMDANNVMRYGRLSQDKPDQTIYFKDYSQRICWGDNNIPVSNKSLGQFIGIVDKCAKEVYADDLAKDDKDNVYRIYAVPRRLCY